MQIAGIVLGLLGGLFGLFAGWARYSVASILGSSGIGDLIVPMIGLVGAALAFVSPAASGAMMLASAVLMMVQFGFHALTAVSILLLLIAAGLLLGGTREGHSFVEENIAKLRGAGWDRLGGFKPEPLGTRVSRSASLHQLNGTHRILLPERKLSTDGIVIGRGPTSNFVVNHPSVSREHVRIKRDRSGRLVAEDMNSVNGIWYNDVRVKIAALEARAILRLGDVSFRVDCYKLIGTVQACSLPREKDRIDCGEGVCSRLPLSGRRNWRNDFNE